MPDYLDIELLIGEVERRPVLWDNSSEDYKDKDKKAQAWAEVCQVLIEGYEERDATEKINIGKDVQSKWRNVRDSYAKNIKKQNETKRGSGAVRPRRYIFSEQLSFLKRVVSSRATPDHTSGDASSEDAPQDFAAAAAGQSIVSLEDSSVIQSMEVLEQQETDDDKDFLMSLLPLVKSLDADDKLHFRMQVMQVLMDFKGGQHRPTVEPKRFPDPLEIALQDSTCIVFRCNRCSHRPRGKQS
ncbi:uncharacterized protein LOC135212388 [Macrobrachium nipponense]|uniref:uncharacterized protein LOC135212388 n=1 Tax=Macrobrachium nipponense TaxID=159736 RepID=UPI0030C8589F